MSDLIVFNTFPSDNLNMLAIDFHHIGAGQSGGHPRKVPTMAVQPVVWLHERPVSRSIRMLPSIDGLSA
jgi:hypothetical protein